MGHARLLKLGVVMQTITYFNRDPSCRLIESWRKLPTAPMP